MQTQKFKSQFLSTLFSRGFIHNCTDLEGLDAELKINKVVKEIYRATDVSFSPQAKKKLKEISDLGYDHFPVCMAKTQYSFSTDASKKCAPTDHEINIREVRLSAGAEFIVAIAGDIMTMPGLPKKPAAYEVRIGDDGKIQGLF